MQELKVIWREAAKFFLESDSVVKRLHIIKDESSGLITGPMIFIVAKSGWVRIPKPKMSTAGKDNRAYNSLYSEYGDYQ